MASVWQRCRFRNPSPQTGRLRALATTLAPRARSDQFHIHAPTPLTTTSLSSVNAMAINYNARALIQEVKERPALWNQQCDEYCDRDFKKKCWEDIAQALNRQKRLKPRERIRLGIFFQKKWKCIRGSYSREILRRKAVITGTNPTKRKSEYRYFKYLSFLEAGKRNNEQATETEASSINIIPRLPRTIPEEAPRAQQVRTRSIIQKYFEIHANNKDLSYLKNLLPFFMQLSEKDKIEMRINILNLFKPKTKDGLLKRFLNKLLSLYQKHII